MQSRGIQYNTVQYKRLNFKRVARDGDKTDDPVALCEINKRYENIKLFKVRLI